MALPEAGTVNVLEVCDQTPEELGVLAAFPIFVPASLSCNDPAGVTKVNIHHFTVT